MSLVNKLKGLASNIFNPGSTGGSSNPRPPASNVQTIDFRESPTGILGTDPLGFQTFSFLIAALSGATFFLNNIGKLSQILV